MINAGLCEQFATDLKAEFDKHCETTATILSTKDVITPKSTPTGNLTDYPEHYFVVHQNRCYDAECAEGVSNVLHLPFLTGLNSQSPPTISKQIVQ